MQLFVCFLSRKIFELISNGTSISKVYIYICNNNDDNNNNNDKNDIYLTVTVVWVLYIVYDTGAMATVRIMESNISEFQLCSFSREFERKITVADSVQPNAIFHRE